MPASLKDNERRHDGLRRSVIGRQLALYFIVILALFAGSGLAYFFADRDLAEARQWTEHTTTVLDKLSRLALALRSQESALRGHLIAGQPEMLAGYEIGEAAFEKALREVRFLVSDNPAQGQRLERLADLYASWKEDVAAPALDAVDQANLEAARIPVVTGAGPRLLNSSYQLINNMASLERQLLTQRKNAAAISRWRTQALILGMAVMGLFVVIAAMVMVRRNIVRPLNRVTAAMRAVADGDLDHAIPHRRLAGEVGDNARALEHFRDTARREEATSWVREQLGRLSFLILEADTIENLSRVLLSSLAPLVRAEWAALYGLSESAGLYTLIGSHGLPRDAAERQFATGEGLAGEVARSGEFKLISNVPDDYFPIASALGSSAPACLLIAPGEYAHEVLTVLELASFEAFGERHRLLLEALMPVIAIAVSSLKRRDKTEHLLQATREQAQQLKLSEAEIRQSNDELRRRGKALAEQSEALQVSEEELRVQTEELQATNEELRQNGDELEAQQRELIAAHDELETKARELERVSRYKSEFLANMSHELRTPLNSLLILSRSLSENRQGNLSGDQCEAADTIYQSGRNLLELINDILDLSKVEAGKLRVEAAEMSLQMLLSNLRRNFDPLAEEKGLEFKLDVAADAAMHLFTDPVRLEQILRNLLANAFKFTAKGQVRLRIEEPAESLKLRNQKLLTDSIAFVVEDEGIGIPADKLDKIFQAFEQVDASTSRVYGGTGLGLSISRHLASLLGGEIHAWSQDGQGSRFTLVVPVRMPADSAAPTAVQQTVTVSPAAEVSGADILIIEDDSSFARILQQEARQKGYSSRVAGDGETGLEMAREKLPTGILLDIGLPGMDGWQVLEQLKADPDTASIPVHVISAADDDGSAVSRGAAGYLSKPVDMETLSRLLTDAGGRIPGKRLLIIDDDRDARQSMRQLLGHEPVELVFAETGAQAREFMDSDRFDCILLDLNLPDISGFDLLEEYAERPVHAPIIVFSGRELSDEETQRLRAFTDSIVIKGSRSADRLLDEVNLFLHRIDDKPAIAAPPRPITESDLAEKCVLVVDDDMRNTFALSRILRERGMQVLMAQDGRKALTQLEENDQIDIVLMDIMMPVMDGYETMQAIRADTAFSKLPIIALTAKAMDGDRQKCLQAGANDYLPKPIDIDKLLSLMRAWV